MLQKRLGGIRRSSIGILTTHRLPTQLPQCTPPHLTTPHTVTAVVSQHMVTAGVTQHISVHSTPTNTHTVTGDPTSQRSDTKHGILTDPSHKSERSELRSDGGGVGWCGHRKLNSNPHSLGMSPRSPTRRNLKKPHDTSVSRSIPRCSAELWDEEREYTADNQKRCHRDQGGLEPNSVGQGAEA